jgi:hypothetical protein
MIAAIYQCSLGDYRWPQFDGSTDSFDGSTDMLSIMHRNRYTLCLVIALATSVMIVMGSLAHALAQMPLYA